MPATAWTFYNSFREWVGDGTIDLDDDTFLLALVGSGYTPDYEAHSVASDLTAELSGNGYARQSLNTTWVRTGAEVAFDADDAGFLADGGPIAARRGIIIDDTPTSPADPLVCESLLDDTPADVSVTDGNTLTIEFDADGVFTFFTPA